MFCLLFLHSKYLFFYLLMHPCTLIHTQNLKNVSIRLHLSLLTPTFLQMVAEMVSHNCMLVRLAQTCKGGSLCAVCINAPFFEFIFLCFGVYLCKSISAYMFCGAAISPNLTQLRQGNCTEKCKGNFGQIESTYSSDIIIHSPACLCAFMCCHASCGIISTLVQ